MYKFFSIKGNFQECRTNNVNYYGLLFLDHKIDYYWDYYAGKNCNLDKTFNLSKKVSK